MDNYQRIRDEVPIYDLFEIADPEVTYLTREKPCQIRCPFHGEDKHPSARAFPDSNSFHCFYCSKSWNPVTFWAEINNWFTKNDKLDIGRAIEDLERRFNLATTSKSWEKQFYAARQDLGTEREYTEDELDILKDYYAWRTAQAVNTKDLEWRRTHLSDVIRLWDDLEALKDSRGSYHKDLKSWYSRAKMLIDG